MVLIRVLDFIHYAGGDGSSTSNSRVRAHDTIRDLENSYAEILCCLVRCYPSSDSGYLPCKNGSWDRLDVDSIRHHRVHCWTDVRSKDIPAH